MDPYIVSGIGLVISTLAGVVTYLYNDNRRLHNDHWRCQAENAALRAELTSLTALIEQMRWMGVETIEAVIVANMATGLIVEWNPGATILLHWPEREMLGKPITRIMSERYREEHLQAMIKLVSSKESPKRGPIYGFALTKDGVEIPVEITLSGWRDGNAPMVAACIKRQKFNLDSIFKDPDPEPHVLV